MASLAERLGHGPGARLLIVNCDDLGVSRPANRAILRAMTQGLATSASLMVPCPWAEEAARMLRGLPVGVHLTLTSEYAAPRWRGLTAGASLHDAAGFLHARTVPALASVAAEEARAECRAQIEAALGWGVDVTHLDAHMNIMQARADLFEVMLDLATAFRLPVRMFPAAIADRYGFPARARAAARGVPCPDHLLYPWPRPMREVLLEALPALPPGVTEIFAHPVEDGSELRGYDPFAPDLRAADARGLLDPALAAVLEAAGVQRISYAPLRDLLRGDLPRADATA
ncbi:MAG: ChbG/HpnK family deacetylase [Acetobacteraceae bacterium]|nr:ChbG/HpnK family deacetylase [Acetobacteraceae bacterium]